MSKKIAIVIPTYKRSDRMEKIVENIFSVTPNDLIDIVFVVESEDENSVKKSQEINAITLINQRTHNYAGAVNTAIKTLTHEYFFIAADDFLFHENWLPPLLELSKNFSVVGPNDLGNPNVAAGNLAVSYLVSREYIPRACIGYPDLLIFEGYLHNYTDTELTETAISNKEYVYCPNSIVEHMHPIWNKAEVDETYIQGSYNGLKNDLDAQTYMSRRHLWINR